MSAASQTKASDAVQKSQGLTSSRIRNWVLDNTWKIEGQNYILATKWNFSHTVLSHEADFPCHCAVTSVLISSSLVVLAWCCWGSWIFLPQERLDPAVCVWLKSWKRFGSPLQLWFAETNGWANEPLKASLICPMALLESQDGEATEGARGCAICQRNGAAEAGDDCLHVWKSWNCHARS